MAEHTFRLSGPTAAQLLQTIDPPVTASGVGQRIYKVVDVGASWLADAQAEMERHGWAYVGSGDQRPAATAFTQTYSATQTTITAHPSWTAPSIAGAYSGGVLNLLAAAANMDLNDLRTKCATLEAEIVSLRSTVDQCLKINNALVDLLQAHGIAS